MKNRSVSNPKSITSDTRLTNSNILNLSSFDQGFQKKSIPKDHFFSNQI